MTHRRTIVEGDIKKFIDRELLPLQNHILLSIEDRPTFYTYLTRTIIDNRDLIQRQVEEMIEEENE